jgi:Domain of unknown function (DUF1330)
VAVRKLQEGSHEDVLHGGTIDACWYRHWRGRGADAPCASKAPVYVVTEIDVSNIDAYTKEYVPVVRPIIAKSGGKLVAVSQDPTTIEGAPPKIARCDQRV